MKFIAIMILSLSAMSAFSSDIGTTVSEIEKENNAVCEEASQGRQFCSGAMFPGPRGGFGHGYGGGYENSAKQTCLYAVKFDCKSNGGDFSVKLRVKEGFNRDTLTRESSVWKVIYYR